ncbi:hypothetical protein BAUCODRAFT_34014 [Baudoinia panamericana UAMH 10762]|uniref:Uncharacterized protein n=1 Tax=Baudoinia panamericana (strain UAMH 10762) TaxID=717646 RepID=M2NBV3_BAUPA|nr:uncharacterized protein BAUCODRAFT_34014 [Baudoinia panamericana UAMH 10762]EMC96639.1 hypothetical protein BAUCODRAFT_34014 [Baudoinia panamericana UAMH 10762]
MQRYDGLKQEGVCQRAHARIRQSEIEAVLLVKTRTDDVIYKRQRMRKSTADAISSGQSASINHMPS